MLPRATVAEEGEIEIVIDGRIKSETVAAFDGSACGVAMICTLVEAGRDGGAVYTPLEEIVPHAAPEQPVPPTLQEMARLGLELGAGVRTAV
jgi:hypothetical protein